MTHVGHMFDNLFVADHSLYEMYMYLFESSLNVYVNIRIVHILHIYSPNVYIFIRIYTPIPRMPMQVPTP